MSKMSPSSTAYYLHDPRQLFSVFQLRSFFIHKMEIIIKHSSSHWGWCWKFINKELQKKPFNIHKCFSSAKNNFISVCSAKRNLRPEMKRDLPQVPFLENGRAQPKSTSSDPLFIALFIILSWRGNVLMLAEIFGSYSGKTLSCQ